jgi:V8-like Glu-specific endopeptidase
MSRLTALSFASRLALTALAMLVAAACTVAPPAELGDARSPIIRGTRETGLPSVVLVARTGATTGSGGLCTGTVIGPYAVLTAKHCVFREATRGYVAVPTIEFLVIVGSDINDRASITDTVGVLEVRTTAGSAIDTDIANGDDVAVLLLERSLGLTPYPLAPSVPASGTNSTVVGYGRTRTGTADPMDSGVKYRATMRVSRAGSRLIETDGPAWTCQGDSGGPLFDASMRVAGVTSFGIGAACTNSVSYFSATPRHMALLTSALAFAPPCTPTTESCNGTDDDCDGTVDEGCLGLGEACTRDDQCGGGACRSIGGRQTCTRDCEPRSAMQRCPFDFYCAETGCGTGQCLAGNPGTLPDGEACPTDLACASGRCTMVAGARRCARACSPLGDLCAPGTVCDTSEGGPECGSCLPFALSDAPRPFGTECTADAACASGNCADPGGFCTRACDAATPCGSGYHCRTGECVRGDLGTLGAGCVVDDDCSTMAPDCATIDGDRVCAAACGAMDACAGGFVCADTSAGRRCVPPGEPLGGACTDSAECRSGLCAGGLCTRICDAAATCPDDFTCTPAGSVSGCFPGAPPPTAPRADRGGCSIAPTAPSRSNFAAWLWLSAVFVMGIGWRRRRNAT